MNIGVQVQNTITLLSIYAIETKPSYVCYLHDIWVKKSKEVARANMAFVLCLILYVVLSKVSGLDAEDWRKEIEKRLSSLEEFNVHLQEENANLRFIVSEIQRENKLLKRELNKVVERVDKCEEAILTHDDTQRTLGRGSVTRKSNGDLKIFSKGNRHSNPRKGERSMESVGSENDNEIFIEWKGQPVPRIGE